MQKLLIIVIALGLAAGLPVSQKKPSTEKPDKPEKTDEAALENVLEYERYLKEVVEALESDPEFRKKLDKAPEADIRSGKIAQELEYVSHHIRSKLDEIKRREIDRLRALANRQFELSNDIDRDHLKIGEHVHHDNMHTFEIEDLRKLILKTSQDLAEADQKRREEFKQYEMQKEFEQQQKIHDLDEDHRKKYEEELKEKKEKHNKHAKVHHPGNKAQLEEVWEKQDHMEGQDFDPRAFFTIHDVDGNGYWDETELKALFIKELDKVYQEGLPEDDLRERTEEMERMREHVFRESDTNRDGLISFQEFIDQTKREEFNRDPTWETVDNMPQYTHEEYLEFEKKRQEEVQRLIAQGTLQAHPNMPQGYYPNGQPNPNQKEMHYQQQPQYHQQQQLHQQQQQQQHYQQQQQQQYQQQQQQYEQHHQQQYNQQQQYQPAQQQPAQNQQQAPPQQQQQQQYQQQPPPQQQQYQQPPPHQQQQQYQQPPVQQPNQPVPVQQQQQNQPPPVQQQQNQPPPVQQQQNQPPPVQQQQNQPPPVQQQNQPPPVQQQQQNQPLPVQPQQVPNQQYVQQPKPIQTGANVPNANALPSDGQKQDVKHH